MISKLRNNQNLYEKESLPLVYQTELIYDFDFENLKKYVKAIKKENKDFLKLTTKFEEMTPKDFFKYYKNFYYWDNNEIKLKLIKYYLKDYEELTIPTYDIYSKFTKMGYGSDAIWDVSYFFSNYNVYAQKGVLERDRIYTKEEISKLVKSNKVLVNEIECSNREVRQNERSIKSELLHLKNIDINSQIDILPNGLYKDKKCLNDEEISKMYKENPKVFKLIKDEFSTNRLENAYETYKKQFDVAKDRCFKRAYQIIQKEKSNIKGKESEVSQIKNFICNL